MKTSFALALTMILAATAPAIAAERYSPSITIDGQKVASRTIRSSPGEVMEWRIEFFRTKTGEQLKKFKMLHGKFMHMVVIKEDSSKMSHVHPKLISDEGTFTIVFNQADTDPDNNDVKDALTEPGRYNVYMEFMPDDGPTRPIPEVSVVEVIVDGPPIHRVQPTDMGENADMVTKYFQADGSAGIYGDKYMAIISRETTVGCNGNLIRFTYVLFHYEKKTNRMGDPVEGYYELTALEPWLMMQGHALVSPVDQPRFDNAKLEHLHAMKMPDSNELSFTVFDKDDRLSEKLNMFWLQVKHEGVVRRLPFTFKKSNNRPRIGCN